MSRLSYTSAAASSELVSVNIRALTEITSMLKGFPPYSEASHEQRFSNVEGLLARLCPSRSYSIAERSLAEVVIANAIPHLVHDSALDRERAAALILRLAPILHSGEPIWPSDSKLSLSAILKEFGAQYVISVILHIQENGTSINVTVSRNLDLGQYGLITLSGLTMGHEVAAYWYDESGCGQRLLQLSSAQAMAEVHATARISPASSEDIDIVFYDDGREILNISNLTELGQKAFIKIVGSRV